MTVFHPSLAAGRWRSFTLMEQLAHVGSEIERAIKWAENDNVAYSRTAVERALELLHLTIADARHASRLKELTRVREALLDYFLGDNEYRSTAEGWRKYFLAFARAAALMKGGR
jgi:hypothetical protein